MSLTLVATFNTKAEANRAIDALVEGGWDRKAVTLTVRKELNTRPLSPLMEGGKVLGPNPSAEADAFKAIALVALIGAVIGAVLGALLVFETESLRAEIFRNNPLVTILAGAIAGLAIGTYSGAVASIRKNRDQKLDGLSPYLSAKERVMLSLSVSDERQEAVSKILRSNGAQAVREWSVITNEQNFRGFQGARP